MKRRHRIARGLILPVLLMVAGYCLTEALRAPARAQPAPTPAPYVAQKWWPDRRPILQLSVVPYPGKFDVSKPEGVAAFQAYVRAVGVAAVANARKVKAQGAIQWDESADWLYTDGLATSYFGDPHTVHAAYAPVASVVPKAFTNVGLLYGVLLRPTELLTRADGTHAHLTPYAPWACLLGKAQYARTTYGALGFYVDSNYAWGSIIPGAVAGTDNCFKSVVARMPDALWIAEASEPSYQFVQCLTLIDASHKPVPADRAYFVINAPDNPARVPEYAAAVRAGSILCEPWYAETAAVTAAYRSAGYPGFN